MTAVAQVIVIGSQQVAVAVIPATVKALIILGVALAFLFVTARIWLQFRRTARAPFPEEELGDKPERCLWCNTREWAACDCAAPCGSRICMRKEAPSA